MKMEHEGETHNRSQELCRRVVTTESFIAEAKEIYGDRYDYSKVDYKNREHKVTIICPVHGEFQVYAREHLDGKGCPKCAKGEKFVSKLKEKFGDKFGLEKFVYQSSTTPVTLVCPIHGEFSDLPHRILKSSFGCPKCYSDYIKEKKDKKNLSQEGKLRHATKIAIDAFRQEHPEFSDEHISRLVEETCPNLYDNNLEVALEVVKDLYRNRKVWTDDNFVSMLKEKNQNHSYYGYSIEEKRRIRTYNKARALLERINKEAKEKTIFLSQCPEYQDEYVKEYFNKQYTNTNKTLAQKFFTLLNNLALYDTDQVTGIVLTFHCYTEPNGDVVFTKNKRNRFDYDENGKPLYSEEEIEKRNNRHETSSTVQSSSKTGNGCMVVIASIIVIVTAFILF